MSPPVAQFLFDFGSPNAYLCHKVIPAIQQRTGTTFEYVPILLGGLFKLANNRSPIEAFAGIANKQAYERLEMQRFIARHALNQFRSNPYFPVNTLHIMRGAVAAQKLGSFMPYVDAMYEAMWEQGRNMNDQDEIINVLTSAGIDAEKLLETSQQTDVKNSLIANTQSAFERGAFGSPTFFVGQEIFFGKDHLRDVEDEILRVMQS
jgi:2-hydroxychromene-2-carboxylate isomerase